MKIKVEDVRRMLETICEPARRHRCDECSHIFECHICTIGDDHVLHVAGNDSWRICLDCAEHMDVTGVFTKPSGKTNEQSNTWTEYDYRTGVVLAHIRPGAVSLMNPERMRNGVQIRSRETQPRKRRAS